MRRVGNIFLADSAVVLGDVKIGAGTSFWPFSCARGDVAPIVVGAGVSVQDFAMLHCQHNVPLEIGDGVVIGHHAVVHCRKVGTGALIGIGARVLDGCEIGADCLVAAGAVVVPGTIVPAGKVVAGVPARVLRDVTPADLAYVRDVAFRYVLLAQAHVAGTYPRYDG